MSEVKVPLDLGRARTGGAISFSSSVCTGSTLGLASFSKCVGRSFCNIEVGSAAISEKSGTKRRKTLHNPKSDCNYVILVGGFKSQIESRVWFCHCAKDYNSVDDVCSGFYHADSACSGWFGH